MHYDGTTANGTFAMSYCVLIGHLFVMMLFALLFEMCRAQVPSDDEARVAQAATQGATAN